MKPKFWQTNEFKRIEKKWYQILKDEKFSDHEQTINGKSILKQNASNCYRGKSKIERENRLRYYELLGHFFSAETEFEDWVESFIMQRRSEGVKIIQISKELELANERCYRGTIRKIIQKYEIKWRIKK